MLTNSKLQLSNSEPLDKLWPVLSPVTCPDKPWFQVLSCTLWQTLTNSESCHTPLSHDPVTPLGLPDISGSWNSSSPNPESWTQPPHELQPNLAKLQSNFGPNFRPNFSIRPYPAPTLFPNIVIISRYLISSDPV